jgi:hypothetical protein
LQKYKENIIYNMLVCDNTHIWHLKKHKVLWATAEIIGAAVPEIARTSRKLSKMPLSVWSLRGSSHSTTRDFGLTTHLGDTVPF